MYIQADGFFPAQFGLNAGNLSNPPGTWLTFTGTFTGLAASGVTLVFDASTGVQLEDPTNPYLVQRITFPYNVQFTSLQAFSDITAPNGIAEFLLAATITSTFPPATSPGPAPVSAASDLATIELVLQADPYMIAGENWWLSNDMRVFTVQPNALPPAPNNVPLQYSKTPWPGDPNGYIQNLLGELNNNPNFTNVPPPPSPPPNTPFSGISTAESGSQTSLALTFDSSNPVYNFGLARVHLQGDSTTLPVRVFFRLFISPSPDTDFDNTTTFRSYPEPDPVISLLGFPSNDMTSTIPFFAAARVNTNADITSPTPERMTAQPDSPWNAFPIKNPMGGEVYAYYGCYLDLNQDASRFPLNPETTPPQDGPWPKSDIQSIPSIIMGQHACLVAEIAYDPDPIPSGANAATSDKIGQENLRAARIRRFSMSARPRQPCRRRFFPTN